MKTPPGAVCDMDYLPPVVIEQVRPSAVYMGWAIPGLHFRREYRSVGVDYDSTKGMFVGARFGDSAQTATGRVHDSRWTIKIGLPF